MSIDKLNSQLGANVRVRNVVNYAVYSLMSKNVFNLVFRSINTDVFRHSVTFSIVNSVLRTKSKRKMFYGCILKELQK